MLFRSIRRHGLLDGHPGDSGGVGESVGFCPGLGSLVPPPVSGSVIPRDGLPTWIVMAAPRLVSKPQPVRMLSPPHGSLRSPSAGNVASLRSSLALLGCADIRLPRSRSDFGLTGPPGWETPTDCAPSARHSHRHRSTRRGPSRAPIARLVRRVPRLPGEARPGRLVSSRASAASERGLQGRSESLGERSEP